MTTSHLDPPASGVRLEMPNGVGVPSVAARDPFRLMRRRHRQWRVPGTQWISPIAYYWGPFEGDHALEDAAQFFRKDSVYGGTPQVYLTATEHGLGILPTRRLRAEPIWISYPTISTIRLDPASRARMSVMTPATSDQLGRVTITRTDGKRAEVTGSTVDNLAKLLCDLGATAG